MIEPTAAKDSQKPAANGAQGSKMQTMAAAVDNTATGDRARPDSRATPATASIQQVRCAGISHPASAA